MDKLVDRAIELHGEDLINQHIKSASQNAKHLDTVRAEALLLGISPETRALLGKAAQTKKAGWFKSVTWMEDVARDIVGPDLENADAGFRKLVDEYLRLGRQCGSMTDLLAIDRGIVTAPAGCGKTQLIAEALTRHTATKPILVLTHTNAGVVALRGRLDRAGVPSKAYRLSTIDGWAMRLISTFPARSAHEPRDSQGGEPRYRLSEHPCRGGQAPKGWTRERNSRGELCTTHRRRVPGLLDPPACTCGLFCPDPADMRARRSDAGDLRVRG